MTRGTIHWSRRLVAALLALLVPLLAGSSCTCSPSASDSSGDPPDTSVVETPVDDEEPPTEEELALDRELEEAGRRIAERLRPGPHDDDGDGIVDRIVEETSTGDTVITRPRSGLPSDTMVFRAGELLESTSYFPDGRLFREERTIETVSATVRVDKRDSNGDGVTDFVSTWTYDKVSKKAWIKTEMLQQGGWKVMGEYDATTQECSMSGKVVGSASCPKCDKRGESQSCRQPPDECCPSGTSATFAPIGQAACCQIMSPANWFDDVTMRPIPGFADAKIYVASSKVGSSQGPDSGRCTRKQLVELKDLFNNILQMSVECLGFTNQAIRDKLEAAIKTRRLRIGCGYCGQGAQSTIQASSMNLNPNQLDESMKGGVARESMKEMVLHELLHWAGEKHSFDAIGSQPGRSNEGSGVDRVYACGRTCGGCIAVRRAGCYDNQTNIGDTQFDCSRCAETDTLARWVYCGSRMALEQVDTGSAVIVPAACDGLQCAKQGNDEVVYAPPAACGRRPHMTCDFYDEFESPGSQSDTLSDCILACSSGYKDPYLMVEGAEPEASCSYQDQFASRSEYPWDRCNVEDRFDPLHSADHLCGFDRTFVASPHD